MIDDELRKIKKIYGETMMHLCRKLFPTLLETNGLLFNILMKNLAPTKSIAKDIIEKELEEEFRDWIYSFVNVEKKEKVDTGKTPFALMREAGYTLYQCKSEEEIQSFRKYWARGEELCTFSDGNRLDRCYVFFAVHKNAKKLKREDFIKPERQDEYGVSVISIQFGREINVLSIKNRYNHRVGNPDATFSNNLDNIIEGLTTSFEKFYHLKIIQELSTSAYFLTHQLNCVKAPNNKYYRYRIENNGRYYCENNIIIDNGRIISDYSDNSERYILADNYIIDLKENDIFTYEMHVQGQKGKNSNSFVDSIKSVGVIAKINVRKDNDRKIIEFVYQNKKVVTIVIDKNNQIIEYENNYVKKIGQGFLKENKTLKRISLNNAIEIGDDFLYYNEVAEDISLDNARKIGHYFMPNNRKLKAVYLFNATEIGDSLLMSNEILVKAFFPSLKKMHNQVLASAINLEEIYMPNVEYIGDGCLMKSAKIKYLELNNLKKVGSFFMYMNKFFNSYQVRSEMEKRNEKSKNR